MFDGFLVFSVIGLFGVLCTHHVWTIVPASWEVRKPKNPLREQRYHGKEHSSATKARLQQGLKYMESTVENTIQIYRETESTTKHTRRSWHGMSTSGRWGRPSLSHTPARTTSTTDLQRKQRNTAFEMLADETKSCKWASVRFTWQKHCEMIRYKRAIEELSSYKHVPVARGAKLSGMAKSTSPTSAGILGNRARIPHVHVFSVHFRKDFWFLDPLKSYGRKNENSYGEEHTHLRPVFLF